MPQTTPNPGPSAAPPSALQAVLTKYAAYHRDTRNILTHLFGIPLIVLAAVTLLSRTSWTFGGYALTPAMFGAAATALYYWRLDVRYGAIMSALLALCVWAGDALVAQHLWLTAGIGLFVLGWIIQFVGHYYEGRKPAFVDDLIGLLAGPLFIVAELGFMFGWRKDLQQAIEAQAGPTRGPAHKASV